MQNEQSSSRSTCIMDAAQSVSEAFEALDAFLSLLASPTDEPLDQVRPSALFFLLQPIHERLHKADRLLDPRPDQRSS